MAAYDVLEAVREREAYTNLVLPTVLGRRGLTGRDAAFATELAAGTLRRRGSYDAVLASLLDRPLRTLQPAVLDVLRLGAHQVLAMRVPPHAAVATSVALVRARVGGGPTGLVNAVLRRVAAHDLEDWVRRVAPDPAADPHGHAALAHSHPGWVVDLLAEALGGPGELEALLEADNAAPNVVLAARPGLATLDELVRAGAVATGRSPYAAVLPAGDPGAVPAVAQGRAGVQDEGSQLVTLALARAEVAGRDAAWLDMCAGPGGKAALLGGIARQRGARLLANEPQAHRARLVAPAVSALGAHVGVVVADATRPAWRPGTFDRVLVDAPCSGLGALRRRPEARWRRTPEDLAALTGLQRRLLVAALDAVRPGGVVGYVTCSPVRAETDAVVRTVLGDRTEAELVDAVPLVEGATGAGAHPQALEGTVQLWPHRDGTDAMYLALLRRR